MTNSLKKILLVEDEKDIQEITKIALEDVGGFTVQVCDSGELALKTVLIFQPQLIIMDVMMPGMDGPQTLSALRNDQATSAIPVIFMTAKAQRSEIDYLMKIGAISVIPKPFDPMLLPDQIRLIWDKI